MRVTWALIPANLAWAGCLSTVEPPAGSACTVRSAEAVWMNAPATRAAVRMPNEHYDQVLADAALGAGVAVAGEARFELRAQGRQLVEVFLLEQGQKRHSYVLEAGGVEIDGRSRIKPGPERLSPGPQQRFISLAGAAWGPTVLVVRTDAPRWVLSAVRWTPWETFERELVPKWLERARHWVKTPIFGRGVAGASMRRNYLQQLGDRLVLSGRAEIQREATIHLARAWYWVAAENHQPREIERTAELFEQLLKVAPEEPVVRQMITASCLGINVRVGRMPQGDFCGKVKPVPWRVDMPAPPAGAPAWAVAQRQLARRMEAITRWWVEERQQPNGELGGGWSDDVEILRHWGPQALGLGSEVAAHGIRRLADGLWASGALKDGYDRQVSDVEHSSEATTDTVPLRVALAPEDAEARNRLGQTAACSENWIARQPDGEWRFRSSWFNCREFDPRPERAVDVHLNTRAMGPALWHACLSRDRALIGRITRWAESWVKAMRATAHGKPAGIFPSVLNSADGTYLVRSDRWDKPNAEWDYYQWSGGSQEALASLLLAVYEMTGEARWLKAVEESFQILERCETAPELCAEIRQAPEAFFEWRRRSGNPRYDKAFGYVAQRPDGEVLGEMERQAREMEQRLSVNFDMYTSEVIWTDRVYYSMPAEYRQRLFGGEAPRGDRYPTFAVTWPPTATEFARAVLEAGEDRLRLVVYHFGERAARVPVRVWRLRPGRYVWDTGAARGDFEITKLPQVVEVDVPPLREVRVEVRPRR